MYCTFLSYPFKERARVLLHTPRTYGFRPQGAEVRRAAELRRPSEDGVVRLGREAGLGAAREGAREALEGRVPL